MLENKAAVTIRTITHSSFGSRGTSADCFIRKYVEVAFWNEPKETREDLHQLEIKKVFLFLWQNTGVGER